MKAIITKYHGPTNTKGSRISATDDDGNRISISRESALSSEDCHKAAVVALCKKIGWRGTLQGGYTATGMAWVFVDERYKVEV